MNLIEDLQKEVVRNREILKIYEEIPAGQVAAMFIKKDIEFAEKSISEIDTVSMIRALKTLRETKL